MSNHHIVVTVSRRIRQLLWTGFKTDQVARSIVRGERSIIIGPPDPSLAEARFAIWLYQVRPNLYQADLPMRHSTDVAEAPPLPVDLLYQLSPMLPAGNQDGAEQVILGRAIQIMAANPHLYFMEPGFEETLRVTLEDLSLEEQILLWRARRVPMRTALYYKLSFVRIDPLQAPEG
jgi:hypothetical protein